MRPLTMADVEAEISGTAEFARRRRRGKRSLRDNALGTTTAGRAARIAGALGGAYGLSLAARTGAAKNLLGGAKGKVGSAAGRTRGTLGEMGGIAKSDLGAARSRAVGAADWTGNALTRGARTAKTMGRRRYRQLRSRLSRGASAVRGYGAPRAKRG